MIPPSYTYILTFYDLLLAPLYLIIAFLIIKKWKNSNYSESSLKKYIYPAVICRLFGCVFISLLYHFYYRYGDTFGYFTGANEIWKAFIHSPAIAWELITEPAENYSKQALSFASHLGYTGFPTSHSSMFKIAGAVGLLGFGSYLPIAIFYSLLSFWGTWMIYLVFVKAFPHLARQLAIATLFIPSVIVWSNGILKEPLCMFGLGLCFYTFSHILERRKLFKNMICFLLGAAILLTIKNYIFYAFITGACMWSYRYLIVSIRPLFFKWVAKGVILSSILILSFYFFTNLSVFINEKITNTFEKTEYLQDAMIRANENRGGSAYIISTATDFSFSGIVQSFLLSINVALFRPYIWECRNVLMLFNFFESFITAIFVILLFFKAGIRRILSLVKQKPVLLFSIVFSLLMAAMAGFISFNFGTLIRYKAPFMPFLYAFLFILIYSKKPYNKASDLNGTSNDSKELADIKILKITQ